jgi:hypothetical protein
MSENSINGKYERRDMNVFIFLIVHLIVFPVGWVR